MPEVGGGVGGEGGGGGGLAKGATVLTSCLVVQIADFDHSLLRLHFFLRL